MRSKQHNYAITDTEGRFVISANSHSVSYSYLSYRLAYIKANFPTEFYSSLLSAELRYGNGPKSKDNMIRYREEANGFGIRFMAPTLNGSLAYDYVPMPLLDENGNPTSQDSKIILEPLATFDAIGETTADAICAGAPYDSLEDFCARSGVGPSIFNSLVDADLFKDWQGEMSKDYMKDYFLQLHHKNKSKSKPTIKPAEFKGFSFKTIKRNL